MSLCRAWSRHWHQGEHPGDLLRGSRSRHDRRGPSLGRAGQLVWTVPQTLLRCVECVWDQEKIGIENRRANRVDGIESTETTRNNGGVGEKSSQVWRRGCRVAKGDGGSRRANRIVVRSVGWIVQVVVVELGERREMQQQRRCGWSWNGEARAFGGVEFLPTPSDSESQKWLGPAPSEGRGRPKVSVQLQRCNRALQRVQPRPTPAASMHVGRLCLFSAPHHKHSLTLMHLEE